MEKLKKPASVETTFGVYTIDEKIGEGGAGRVFGGKSSEGTPVAVKVLAAERISADKRRRFRNEIAFLARSKHANIVSVLDHGIGTEDPLRGPFYVMRRYQGSLRTVMQGGLAPEDALRIFHQILEGVEAAHLQGAIHRDLKPENVLFDASTHTPAIADFGVASFTDEIVATTVETAPTQRLANFMYAAPEQRTPGNKVGVQADIYALGMMLNEMFTRRVPHGTDFELIEAKQPDLRYLDPVVARMMKQNPADRFTSVAEVKAAIAKYREEFLTVQRISQIDQSVITSSEIDNPLAFTPPKVVGAEWSNGVLRLTLDHHVNSDWVNALHNIGSYTSVMGIPPTSFQFSGNIASVSCTGNDAQRVIDFFKEWLPIASETLKYTLQQQAQRKEAERKEQLRRQRVAEEQRLNVNRSLRF